jgi:hypothetical protein
MSNEVVDWQTQMEAAAKATRALERPISAVISLRAGIMNYSGTPIPGNKIPAVIVAYAFERAYYASAWDPNVIVSPDCFALSLDGLDMVPHDMSSKKQHTDCTTCPMNQWQDNPKKPGKRHKLCKEKRRLVIMPGSEVKDGGIAKAELATMTLPVTSLKNWANYINMSSTAYSRPPWGLLTEISVVPHMQNQFEVKFEVVGQVNEKYLGDVSAKIEEAQTLALTPYERSPEPAAPKSPEGKKKY